MSHIRTRKLIENRTEYAGRSWAYDFRFIPKHCAEESVRTVCQRLSEQIAPITKSWNDDLNSEWISRIYFSAKMILASSVMAQSLVFAKATNLRMAVPYLDYYTVLNTLRSVLLTNPNVLWLNGELLKTTHTKTINIAIDILGKFDKNMAATADVHIRQLKAFRELIAYRAPSSGDNFPEAGIDVIEMCRLIAEVAQLQSELIEASVLKHVRGDYALKTEAIDLICAVEIDGFAFSDAEDHYRLDYLQRKYPRPTSMLHIMSEGHVEDFFGSWCAAEKQEGHFDPDGDWRIIFDVP